MFLSILFSYMYHQNQLWKVTKNLKTFSCDKRHKMIFSFVFLLKIGKLHFSDYLRNKAHSPTFNFAFCNLHEQKSNTYKKSKIRKLNLRGTSLLKLLRKQFIWQTFKKFQKINYIAIVKERERENYPALKPIKPHEVQNRNGNGYWSNKT